jgi:hypothetical protein
MNLQDIKTHQSRRHFLQTILIAPACTSAFATSSGKPATSQLPTSTTHTGYRETEHIRRYYETL